MEQELLSSTGGFFSGFGMIALILIVIAVGLVVTIIMSMALRQVVSPNEVHIVRGRKNTISYGKQSDAGNAYWRWPSWVPVIGVTSEVRSLAIFEIPLKEYDAYDVDKVPFLVDIVGFFRVDDPDKAATRFETEREMQEQIRNVLRGAVRRVLALNPIGEIMLKRSEYGEAFTSETSDNLAAWGVVNVQDIEFMDISDPTAGQHDAVGPITRIMAEKQSEIEQKSRKTVADNHRNATVAETEATRDEEIAMQDKLQRVGEREAEQTKQVGIANEQAKQEIKTQVKITAERDMAVQKVNEVKQAEITKEVQVVQAQQVREVDIVKAEGTKQSTILVAQGDRDGQVLEAEGVLAQGTADAESKRLYEMATVDPQIVLATEIGENEGYQSYLVNIREVEKDEVVGQEQAKALQDADVKVISNTGNVSTGVNNVMDLFSSKGGTAVGGAIEAFAQTPEGQKVLEAFGVRPSVPGIATTIKPKRSKQRPTKS